MEKLEKQDLENMTVEELVDLKVTIEEQMNEIEYLQKKYGNE